MERFDLGDSVRIRSWESMKREFGLDCDGDIASPVVFTTDMQKYCGSTATISRLIGNSVHFTDDSPVGRSTYCYTTDMIEPVGFEAGQIYRVGNGMQENGNIIKISKVYACDFDYDTVRGTATNCYAGCDSTFARSLELLTGPQIGEAIRKYDAEHSGTGVREVKRSANVGEYIKIVNADACGQSYKNGDILKVVSLDALAHANGIGIGIGQYEYVVLEGYKPEKEEHRKAKVGDTIKVLRDNGGRIKPGTVWKVKSVDTDDGTLRIIHADDDCTWSCDKDNYIVLSSGKHIYSATDIQTAKDFVLRTIYDLAAKDINVILSHSSGDENDNSAFSCYILGDKAALGDVEGGVKITGTKEYTSSCSENDEPNEWVGKAVALCKALHRPLPSYTL